MNILILYKNIEYDCTRAQNYSTIFTLTHKKNYLTRV